MVNRPRKKGTAFESYILKQIQKIDPSAYRCAQKGIKDCGDIRAFEFDAVECKHHEHISKNKVMGWWREISEKAAKADLFPVLIYREDRKPVMVMFERVIVSDGNLCIDFQIILFFDEWIKFKSNERET